MKKFLYLFVCFMLGTVCLGLSSCGDDDKDEPSATTYSLDGYWEKTYSMDGTDYLGYMYFDNEGSGWMVECESTGYMGETFNWVLNDWKLTLNDETFALVWKNASTYTMQFLYSNNVWSDIVVHVTKVNESDLPFSMSEVIWQ